MSVKFGIRDSRGVLLPLTVSHAELGTMVGASRQHITMQLKDFERDGSIIRDGRRLIVKPERLETALDD
jgi:CRP-like cAMP-binding protein